MTTTFAKPRHKVSTSDRLAQSVGTGQAQSRPEVVSMHKAPSATKKPGFLTALLRAFAAFSA